MMKCIIWLEVKCANCDRVVGWDYKNASSVSKLKAATRDWIFDRDLGNLCPECKRKLRCK